MDEQVPASLIGGDEAESLLVAEPFDRSGWHCGVLLRSSKCCHRGGCSATTTGACTDSHRPGRTALPGGTVARGPLERRLPSLGFTTEPHHPSCPRPHRPEPQPGPRPGRTSIYRP